MSFIKPLALKPDGVIGAFSPSRWYGTERLKAGKDALEAMGYTMVLHPQNGKKHGHFAGTVAERIDALHDLFTDPNIDAIFCVGGGYGAVGLLDHIDYELIKKYPKIFMGYSDVTALLHAIHEKTSLTTFHGPMFNVWMQESINQRVTSSLQQTLFGEIPTYEFTEGIKIHNTGQAQGLLTGGNITLLRNLIGTPYQPDTNGKILFIEVIWEELFNVERILTQMKQAGMFDDIKGLILGEVVELFDTPYEEKPFGRIFEEMALEQVANMDIPVISNFPCGHGAEILTFPLDISARFSVEENHIGIKILESAVT